jgi:signal transduction histidine kinase
MNSSRFRTWSWGIVGAVAALLAAIGIFVGVHFQNAIENAAGLSQPHEVQTVLENTGSVLDALQDAVQDYLIDGATGMRIQYEDATRALNAKVSELVALDRSVISDAEVEAIDKSVGEVLRASREVVDARNVRRPEAIRQLADAELAIFNTAHRQLDVAIATQQELLRQRGRSLRWDVARITIGLVGVAVIVMLVLIGAVMLLDADQQRQTVDERKLRSENERLEVAVRERSESLAQVNRELVWFSKRALQIQEQERRALALELHDQIGQELAALSYTLTRCEREMPGELSEEFKTLLHQAIEIARAAYGDVHNLALDLRPAMLDQLGLVPTLQWYARQQAKHARCRIEVEADAIPAPLASDVLITAFRVVQEAVSNAIRHARPQRIEIQLRYRSDRMELSIRDDGSGFDTARASAEPDERFGLGLIGIRQRVQDVGGKVLIESTPGSGTRVFTSLPLAKAA